MGWKHEIIVVDDVPPVLELYQLHLAQKGFTCSAFSTATTAINYLTEHYRRVSLIVSDYDLGKETAQSILKARNNLDQRLPFCLVTGAEMKLDTQDHANLGDVADAMIDGCDAFVQKPLNDFKFIDEILFSTIQMKKPTAMFKIGGSAFDYVKEHGSTALEETLDTLAATTSHQIILTVGAGVIGDNVKQWREYTGDNDEDYADKILNALQLNAKFIISMLNGRNPGIARFVPQEELIKLRSGRTTARENMFNSNITVMTDAPRHLSMGYRTINEPGAPMSVPVYDSDAQGVVLASMLRNPDGTKISVLGLVKRTDSAYLFDPYRDYNPKKTHDWHERQKHNIQIPTVSAYELLNKRSENAERIKLIGEDNKPGHLFEDSALQIWINGVSGIGYIPITHINPDEMYYRGKHIVTKESWPEGKTSTEVRNERLQAIINQDPQAIEHYTIMRRQNVKATADAYRRSTDKATSL